jgi:hypothetical protein
MKPTVPPMTLARFTELLDAYGARPAHWPESDRAAAEALLAAGGEAARVFAEAEALDGVLDAYQVAEVSPRLRARVLEVPAAADRGKRRFGWRLAWAVAFSCFIGVASGALTAPDESVAEEDEWAELTEVSFYADLDLSSEDEP